MKINFWGATDDVTGSMTFLDLPEGVLMIDCGLAQGLPETEKINYLTLPKKPSSLAAVIITHAHLDHSGYLPHLVMKGFKGPIFCTPATAKLMRIILLDSAKLNTDDFYDEENVQQTLRQVKTHDWNNKFELMGITAEFLPAAHILGASSVLLKAKDKRILFSGDLGRTDDPILQPLGNAPEADIIVMESTYGGKNRSGDMEKELHELLITVARESRVAIIASFAVARAQTLLTLIHQFYERYPEEKVRVVIDSPMMKEANKIYQQYSHLTLHPPEVFAALEDIDSIDFLKEWQSLKKKSGPLIIISSSGMLSGGRIGRHLQNWHDDKKAILFLPGYQGVGTPGRAMLQGHRVLKNGDNEEFIWEGEVRSSEAFSSHADQSELLQWVKANNNNPKVFLLHGESSSKLKLQDKLLENGFEQVEIPFRGKSYDI